MEMKEWCVKGCACQCNQQLCGCRDVEIVENRLRQTRTDLAKLSLEVENEK